jgi:exosortase A-associated hydrolase 2
METPFFFPSGKFRLFGVYHEGRGTLRGEGFVFCAPFAEEKLWAHRVLVNFARNLAAMGYPVLRFDYMGSGDSEGDFGESSLETMFADANCAISTLRQKAGSIKAVNLLGLRLGATVAALVEERTPGIGKLVLWDPVIDGSDYMREMLRINLSTQTAVYRKILHNTDALIQSMREGSTVNVDGYEMACPMYEQIAGVNLANMADQRITPVLIIQISRQDTRVSPTMKRLRERYPNGTLTVAVEEPFWKELRRFYSKAENLYEKTIRWLREHDN